MGKYFNGIPKIEYKGTKGDAYSFKFYNPDEVVNGKTMKDNLKFAMSWWHTLCGEGADIFGGGTQDKSFGETDPMAHAKAKVDAGFEFMELMNIDYFCFHDRDIAPEADSLEETNKRLDEIVDYIEVKMKETGKKLLWGTTNAFSNPRFVHGAATSCNADVFAFAAAQIKKAIEITVRLGGSGYTFWGGREGYATLLNTDLSLELDNMGRMLKMASEYGRKIGFKGDYYIEPKPMEPMTHQYDYDSATVIGFLNKYGLQDDFKLNVEANHATLAGHSFAHELRVARQAGMLGSIDANQGEPFNGWDTDNFPTNVFDMAMAMYELIKAGGYPSGGTNFDAKLRRGSTDTAADLVKGYITGMDTMALAYKIANKIIEDKRIDDFVAARYASYSQGIGKQIVEGSVSFEELEQYALDMGEVTTNESGSQEYIEGILNSLIFG